MAKRSSKSKARSKRSSTRKKPHSYSRGHIEINPRGFGFVQTAEGEFFIPASKVRDAFDGDLVEISHIKHDGLDGKPDRTKAQSGQRPFGRVVRVIERASTSLVGRYEIAEPFGIVVPEDPKIKHDIFTLLSENPGIEDGSLVRVRITQFPTKNSAATGVVEEVLGDADDTSLLIERIIARHKLETEFSASTMEEAESQSIDVIAALSCGYRDIRDRYVFTIDPADARDFDDALSFDLIQGAHADAKAMYRMGIHIADVSAYVGWGSSIDLDARRRATSVYLPDRVIPMLPEKLSNELCSLKPDEDRLCMSVDLYLDENYEILSSDIYSGVMRSNKRMSYQEALAMLESGVSEDPDDVLWKLHRAFDFSKKRLAIRESHGGIDFETKEARVILNEDKAPIGIDIREKTDATSLIEEAMVCANEIVARYLNDRDWPCAYRNHEAPAIDNLKELVAVFQEFKWFTKEMASGLMCASPFAIERILEAASGRVEQEMVTMLLLRSMMRAVYSPENLGHYGLGSDAYCHFTSPIRRYPDLIVHRMLKAKLYKRPEKFDQEVSSLKWLCEHSSAMERVAEEASYDCNKALMVEYMDRFIGMQFDAIVSGVATYGIYVRLDNCAEGLIPVRSLGDEYFIFDPVRRTLKGSNTGKLFRLGQAIKVELKEADKAMARLTFGLA